MQGAIGGHAADGQPHRIVRGVDVLFGQQHDARRFHARQRILGLDTGRLSDLQRVLAVDLRRKREPAAAFVLATELDDFLAVGVDDYASQIGRLLGRGEGLEIDAIGQARDQFAALGIQRQVHRLQEDGNRLGGGLQHAAVFDGQGQHTFAARHLLRQLEAGHAHTFVVDLCRPAEHFRPVNPRDDRDRRSDGHAAFGPRDVQRGGHVVARTVAVTQELDLRLQPGRPVRADVEMAFRRGITREREGGLDRVLAARLTVGHRPLKSQHTIFGSHPSRCHHVALGAADFHDGGSLLVGGQRTLRRVVQHHTADEDRLAGAVHGLVRAHVGQVPLGAAQGLRVRDFQSRLVGGGRAGRLIGRQALPDPAQAANPNRAAESQGKADEVAVHFRALRVVVRFFDQPSARNKDEPGTASVFQSCRVRNSDGAGGRGQKSPAVSQEPGFYKGAQHGWRCTRGLPWFSFRLDFFAPYRL